MTNSYCLTAVGGSENFYRLVAVWERREKRWRERGMEKEGVREEREKRGCLGVKG